MKTRDLANLALKQLMERRLRTILTLLAIAVGVTSIIALSAQVEGVRGEIVKTLETLGPNTIMITIRGTTLFTDVDVANLRRISGIEDIAPLFITSARASGMEDRITIVGASSSDLNIILGGIKLIDGAIYYDIPSPQAVMGYNIAFDSAGGNRYSVGQPILIQIGSRNIMLITVGMLDSYGMSTIVNPDNTIFMPIDYVKLLLRTSGYTAIIVKAKSIEDVDQVIELIRYMFGNRANIASIKQITTTVQTITSQVNLLLMGIAATSFIAAGLGTFNIMTISVMERIREIGILKAIGMKDKGVLALYMFQGLLLGSFGSMIGIIVGSLIAYLIPLVLSGGIGGLGIRTSGQNILTSYSPIINPTYIFISTAIAIIVTLVASAYPSWRAAKMNPVEALRYE